MEKVLPSERRNFFFKDQIARQQQLLKNLMQRFEIWSFSSNSELCH